MEPHKHLLFKLSALKPPLGWMVCFGVLCTAVTEVDLQTSFFSIISSIIHTSCRGHKAVNHRKQPRTALKLLNETTSGNPAPQRQQQALVRVTPAHTGYILPDKSIQTAKQGHSWSASQLMSQKDPGSSYEWKIFTGLRDLNI